MTQPARLFRLHAEPQGPGLSCDEAGLKLAGVSLLRREDGGFAPREADEIEALLACAYGAGPDAPRLSSGGLEAVARALNQGDLAKAMTAAVFLRLPEPDHNGAARLAHADALLAKYSPDQARDDHGRWTSGTGETGVGSSAPVRGAPSSLHPSVLAPHPSALPDAAALRSSPPIPPTSAPTGHVPSRYGVTGSQDGISAEDQARRIKGFVSALVTAEEHLPPSSDSYQKLKNVLDMLDSGKVTINVTDLHSKYPAQARLNGVVDIDLKQLAHLSANISGWNPTSQGGDALAAWGAAAVAHELRHEWDYLHLLGNTYPKDKAAEFRTEMNAYTVQYAVYQALNLNAPPDYLNSMSAKEIHDEIVSGANRSTHHWETGQ